MERYHRKLMKKLYRVTKNKGNMRTQKSNLPLKNDVLQRQEKIFYKILFGIFKKF